MDIDAGLIVDFARGCAVLGSGGGGATTVASLVAEQAVAECGPVRLILPAELAPETLVMPVSTIGSPTVAAERIGSTREAAHLRDQVERIHRRPVGAVLPSEIGGMNGLVALSFAARLGLPLLDADAMGRAFPRMDQTVLELAGVSPVPAVLADEQGRTLVIDHVDGRWLERLARAAVDAFGGQATSSDYPLTAEQAARHAVAGSVTRAMTVGAALSDGVDPRRASGAGIRVLATAKVAELRHPDDASTEVLVEGLGSDAGRLLRIEARTEYLAVFAEGAPLAVVPEVIAVLDSRTAEPIPVNDLRYGLRVCVVSLDCAPIWRTPAGMRLGGPEAFGLEGIS
ncbi:DUF917 domain-containing protein [Saccharopolyspora sp. NPDC003752]